MKSKGRLSLGLIVAACATLSGQTSDASESTRELFLTPASREYMAQAEEAAECFGFAVQLYPGFLQTSDNEPAISDVFPFDLHWLIDDQPIIAALIGDGRLYEMAFEHGDFYEEEAFVEIVSMIMVWNLVLYGNLSGANALGEVPDEHYRLFKERRENRFTASLGLALGAPHDLIHQRFRTCAFNPLASDDFNLEDEVIGARLAEYSRSFAR